MKSIFLLFALFGSTAFADWGGVLSGDGKMQNASYENCDMNVDFFLDRPNNSFQVARMDYSCALPNGTLFQAFQDIRMTIDSQTGNLLRHGQVVGTMSDASLEFTLLSASGTVHFQFQIVPGTSAWDVVITDSASPSPILIRLW